MLQNTNYIGKFFLFSVDHCPSDFTRLTYMCLWVSSFPRIGSEAKYECELMGGHLPIVNSAEKHADVQMFVQHNPTPSKTVFGRNDTACASKTTHIIFLPVIFLSFFSVRSNGP